MEQERDTMPFHSTPTSQLTCKVKKESFTDTYICVSFVSNPTETNAGEEFLFFSLASEPMWDTQGLGLTGLAVYFPGVLCIKLYYIVTEAYN